MNQLGLTFDGEPSYETPDAIAVLDVQPHNRCATNATVRELRANDEDHEWYPTTNEIIGALAKSIGLVNPNAHGHKVGGWAETMLDIGAGNGKVLTRIKALCDIERLFAIEISPILCRKIPEDILIVGTDFWKQSLVSKPVDVIYCNPPYSRFEEWAVRIIREGAAKRVYLCIPQRWESSAAIKDAIKFREASSRVVGEFTFEDAEDRKARAKVHLLRVDLRDDCEAKKEDDAFNRLFNAEFAELIAKFESGGRFCPKCGEFMNGKADDQGLVRCSKCYEKQVPGEKPGFKSLVPGDDYVARMVAMYEEDLALVQRNFAAIGTLDRDLMKEFGIVPERIRECLRLRLTNLKNDYWRELFAHMGAITSRLTSDSRKKLLDTMGQYMQVDFTAENIVEVVIWAIRNANRYMESQLVALYERMAEKANVQNYKSNKKVFTDNDWRYLRGWENSGTKPSHFKLDFRLVLERIGGCRQRWTGSAPELSETAAEFIGDLMTVAANLGYHSEPCERYQIHYDGRRNWIPGKTVEFYYTDPKHGRTLLFDIRAFKNGNSHVRVNQGLMLALNVEHGRLQGWLRSPAEAVQELGDPQAAECFNSHNLLGAQNAEKLLGWQEKC